MDSYDSNPIAQRYALAVERISQIKEEQAVPAEYADYFEQVAAFILQMHKIYEALLGDETRDYDLDTWKCVNTQMYADILPAHYSESYANPDYAWTKLGEVYGKPLSFLYSQIRGLTGYVYEQSLEEMTILLELFLEVYTSFASSELPTEKQLRDMLYWFCSDYCDVFVSARVRQSVDPGEDFAVRIVCESDLSDPTYLYRYGEYVTDNEIRTAEYLASLSEEDIARMADTFTEGYRIGFVHGGKDLSKKLTVNIRYRLGFERVVRKAIENFEEMNLRPIIFRYALSTVNNPRGIRIGYEGANANPQYEYDHREDLALYLDKQFTQRRYEVMRKTYETFKTWANGHAGPAVMETFGEEPFVPTISAHAYKLNEKQRQLLVEMSNETSQLTNEYIIGEERSFTIIAFPVPEIGEQFAEIFAETMKINTLDNAEYEQIQQHLIDALDKGKCVHITGRCGNHTDLTVAMQTLEDPFRQTNFENCVADVNIPMGEVFTTPKLEGTNGVLHVKKVFLNGLEYENLELQFADGMVREYSCSNFETEQEGKDYIAANVLFHHESLPMGEFAIGTNTAAYVMANRYDIAAKMPILIAEKTGPHFAVGDTCYSWEEDNVTYNPDGKEIAARDNSISLLRKTDLSKAYFGCHTDITIPYSELGKIEVIGQDGEITVLLEDGRFVLEGTQSLNEALDEA